MAYYNKQETEKRVAKVVELLNEKDTDIAIIYFDELSAPTGKIPAVTDIEFIVIDQSQIKIFSFQNFAYLCKTVCSFGFDQISHNIFLPSSIFL